MNRLPLVQVAEDQGLLACLAKCPKKRLELGKRSRDFQIVVLEDLPVVVEANDLGFG